MPNALHSRTLISHVHGQMRFNKKIEKAIIVIKIRDKLRRCVEMHAFFFIEINSYQKNIIILTFTHNPFVSSCKISSFAVVLLRIDF